MGPELWGPHKIKQMRVPHDISTSCLLISINFKDQFLNVQKIYYCLIVFLNSFTSDTCSWEDIKIYINV